MNSVMLVSAVVDRPLRRDVEAGRRPTPEYLLLERDHGVELMDWTAAGLGPGSRSVGRSLRHVSVALRRAKQTHVIFSDGEHVGIPLALSLQALRRQTPHLTIGHNLLNPAKTRVLRHTSFRPVDRFLTHSANQIETILSSTALSPSQLAVVPYAVDATFWCAPPDHAEEGHIVSAGREHRDYRTLVAALPEGTRLTIADHSPFTPRATRRDPDVWPASVTRVVAGYLELRRLYARASIVVIPVVYSRMPAGITTLLEAMSMAKPVIVTATPELEGIVQHGESGLVVPLGDVDQMRSAIDQLLASPAQREALGHRAREVVRERYDIAAYAAALAAHIADIANSEGGAT
ncbi:MAG: glycosyltransferase family 4 protein [Acidimicrobiaceae bacterium]|nr:glycosyltransferase family 4 protein [Acidimicrobiaceae bacterium]